MKKLVPLLLIVSFFFSCTSSGVFKGQTFGEPFNPEEVLDAEQLITEMGNAPEFETTIRGTVRDVCQNKGCWVSIDLGKGESMRVMFKDYGFFVPKDIAGKEVILKGRAYFETVSIEDQKHYLKDAGKSTKEIDAINEPKSELAFEATGVLIPDETN
jgi:hypothetical protein